MIDREGKFGRSGQARDAEGTSDPKAIGSHTLPERFNLQILCGILYLQLGGAATALSGSAFAVSRYGSCHGASQWIPPTSTSAVYDCREENDHGLDTAHR